jgi:hypothetical protein
MLRRALVSGLLLLTPLTYSAAADLWLHVHVDEGKNGDQRVRVNLPLSVIEQVIPMIENEHLKGGKVAMPHLSDQSIDLPALWQAIRDADDGEFVTVESTREVVRVAKSEGMMLVHVDGDGEAGGARVRVTVPLPVVDALVAAGEQELDLMAAITELRAFRGDLVTVEEDDSRVRVWIDERQESGR